MMALTARVLAGLEARGSATVCELAEAVPASITVAEAALRVLALEGRVEVGPDADDIRRWRAVQRSRGSTR
jgi:hypothetical protein